MYGDSWLLCATVEAKDAKFAELRAEQEAEEARLKKRAEEEEARRQEEIRAANAVYEDKPIHSRLYVSETEAATHEEVAALEVSLSRPLFGAVMMRPLSSFGLNVPFSDRDAEQGEFSSRSRKLA